MDFTEVLYEVSDHVATVWLNRPERLNAATFDMGEQLQEAFRLADRDSEVRCIVLTGKGRGFCSGDDVEAAWGDPRMAETLEQLGSTRPPVTPEVISFLECSKPTIAAVNGAAVGVGMDLALLCDIRIASETAKFGQLFVKLGLTADVAGLWLLPRIVGPSKAAELLFTGDIIDAAEAERIGIVSRVVPEGDVLAAAYELAHKIAANPPLAIRYIKEGLLRAAGRDYGGLAELGAFVGNALAFLFGTADHSEAAQAFLQKRDPVFEGR